MKQYLQLLKDIMVAGKDREGRNGGTRSIFGYRMEFDLQLGFPLLTTKRIYTPALFAELCWFLKGDTNTRYLNENRCTIWDEWADADGELGPVYGKQWRDFGGVDQLKVLLNTLKTNPNDRRQIVSAWNPPEVPAMALPPCHLLFQTYVRDHLMDLQMYQRSADAFLGVPFNIASYAALMHVLAQHAGLRPGILSIVLGDVHIYHDHFEQVMEQVKRQPGELPQLNVTRRWWPWDHEPADFMVSGYNPQTAIKAEVSR